MTSEPLTTQRQRRLLHQARSYNQTRASAETKTREARQNGEQKAHTLMADITKSTRQRFDQRIAQAETNRSSVANKAHSVLMNSTEAVNEDLEEIRKAHHQVGESLRTSGIPPVPSVSLDSIRASEVKPSTITKEREGALFNANIIEQNLQALIALRGKQLRSADQRIERGGIVTLTLGLLLSLMIGIWFPSAWKLVLWIFATTLIVGIWLVVWAADRKSSHKSSYEPQ